LAIIRDKIGIYLDPEKAGSYRETGGDEAPKGNRTFLLRSLASARVIAVFRESERQLPSIQAWDERFEFP